MDQDENQLPYHRNNIQLTDNNTHTSEISETVNTSDQDFDSIIGCNEDALLSLIDNAQDLNTLDEIYNKIQLEMQQKVEVLRKIQKENAEMKNNLDSQKCFLSEMEHFQSAEQKKTDCLREQIEFRRKELEKLHNQQVDDLEKFECDVRNLSGEFENTAQYFDRPLVLEVIKELERELAESMGEMAANKEQLEAATLGFKRDEVDTSFTEISLKTLEDSISDISSLNEKLSQSVEQLTNKMDNLRIKINTLNLRK